MCHLLRNQCHNKHFLDVPAFIIAIHCHLSHPLQSIHLSIVIKYQDAVCRNLLLPSRFPSVGLSNCYIQWSWTVEQLGLWKFWISLCLSTPPGLQVWINDSYWCHHPQLGFPDRTTTLESDKVHRTGRSDRAGGTCPQHSVDTAASSNGWRYSQSSGQAPLNGEKATLSTGQCSKFLAPNNRGDLLWATVYLIF